MVYMIQQSHRLFRVKPRTWYAPREEGDPITPSIASRHIDENGNVAFRYLAMASTLKALKEHRDGNLVDVTADPTQEIKWEGVTVSPQKADMNDQEDRVIREEKPVKKTWRKLAARRGGKKS